MSRTVAEMVAEAKPKIENLTPEAALAEHESGEALFVDIREPEERAANGAIPDSHHAPRGMLEFYADPTSSYHREEFDPDGRLILVCASGGHSALAAETLQQMGYRRVAHLDGGLNAWAAQRFPVERDG